MLTRKVLPSAFGSTAAAVATALWIAHAATGRVEQRSSTVGVADTERICQLTGDVDWETGRPTAARTLTNFGLDAVDLGYPVEHDGKLLLLFGDSWPPGHGGGPAGELPPDDAVGFTSRRELPTPQSCLDLIVHSRMERGKRRFDPATILGSLRLRQGSFNVPSGGVSVRGSLYAFFWTNHCAPPTHLDPSPERPLQRPLPTPTCSETDARNSIGRGVLARSVDEGHTFQRLGPMPVGFVYSIAINTAGLQTLPDDQRLGVFVFGVPRYRASVPYLATAPLSTFSDTATWRFFTGREPDGRPKWVDAADFRPSPAHQIYVPDAPADNSVGEFSITWNAPLRMWVMLYAGVAIRVAPAPWGPWSASSAVLGPADRQRCRFLMSPAGCGDRRDYWPARRVGDRYQMGGFYAPYVMNRYTRRGPQPGSAVVYWLVSTWNPYQVSVMRTTIQVQRPTDGSAERR